MKKLFALIVVAAMCIALLVSCTDTNNGGKTPANNKGGEILEDTPSNPMKFSVVDTTVTVGDVFSVFVNLDATGWTWDSFQFVLKYDNTLVKINEVKTTELTSGMLPLSNLEYAEDMIKVAFATAEELQGGGDIVEIVCEALGEGSFTFEISEPFASRGVTYKATNEIDVVEIDNLAISNGTVTIEPLKEAQAQVHPVFTASSVEAKKGETVKVIISLSDIEQFDSFELVISYDSQILKYVDIKTTEITKDMLNLSNNDKDKGTIKLAFATADELTAEGAVAEIEFEAIAAGTCEIKLSEPYMSREGEQEITEIEGIEVVNGSVTVK